jgi:prepilin-type N-terminal cleavage/methylation domain-containing protein
MRAMARRNGRQGFSLVEMMIAVAISAFAIGSLMATAHFNTLYQLRSEQRSQAILLAERVMEESRRRPFPELAESSVIELPFNRNSSQAANIEIRLYDDAGVRIPNGPATRGYSFVRVEVEVSLNALNADGSARSGLNAVSETLVTWMVPPG